MILCGEASCGVGALEQYRALQPDVTLMDLQMPGMNGFDAVLAIRAEFPSARIIILVNYRCDTPIRSLLRAGVSGCLLKTDIRKQLTNAVRQVFSGGRLLQSGMLEQPDWWPPNNI
jgi:DNA-binding NarL/FixJ family response regulator